MNCNCIETLKADESGKIAEFVARKKATVKKISFNGLGFPWIRKEDGSAKLGCATLSILEVELNEKKKPLKIDILHSYCPFCGVKYE
jgi:hypothetical protein